MNVILRIVYWHKYIGMYIGIYMHKNIKKTPALTVGSWALLKKCIGND